jgi:hypothetical protein
MSTDDEVNACVANSPSPATRRSAALLASRRWSSSGFVDSAAIVPKPHHSGMNRPAVAGAGRRNRCLNSSNVKILGTHDALVSGAGAPGAGFDNNRNVTGRESPDAS